MMPVRCAFQRTAAFASRPGPAESDAAFDGPLPGASRAPRAPAGPAETVSARPLPVPAQFDTVDEGSCADPTFRHTGQELPGGHRSDPHGGGLAWRCSRHPTLHRRTRPSGPSSGVSSAQPHRRSPASPRLAVGRCSTSDTKDYPPRTKPGTLRASLRLSGLAREILRRRSLTT